MEEKLRELVRANSESNRAKWALDWKQQGKSVIGLLCPFVPEELMYAAGILPWRVTGAWNDNVTLASIHRPPYMDLYYTRCLESLLRDDLFFLDGIIVSNRDDDIRRLWDVWVHTKKQPFAHILYVPKNDSPLALSKFRESLVQLSGALEQASGLRITAEGLQKAIEVHNRTRSLLRQLYELRKKKVPPLSGAELLGVTSAARIMPKDVFNDRLQELLPYLEHREAPLRCTSPRLLVSSDNLDDPAYLEIIEETALVAMDDLDTGSRYFWQPVEADHLDPLDALAQRYIQGPNCPRMFFWERQVKQVLDWVDEFRIDGVVELPQMYFYPREWRFPFFSSELGRHNVPLISVKREYHFANAGQLRTRIGAFVEMLEA